MVFPKTSLYLNTCSCEQKKWKVKQCESEKKARYICQKCEKIFGSSSRQNYGCQRQVEVHAERGRQAAIETLVKALTHSLHQPVLYTHQSSNSTTFLLSLSSQ